MKYGLILSLLIAMPCMGQTRTTGEAKTAGPCSPAVSGNNNRIIMNCQAGNKEKVEAPAFHEKTGIGSVSIGGNTHNFTVEGLRKGEIQPLKINNYVPVTIRMHGDSLIFSFKLWSKTGASPVEVENNEVKVDLPGWDWNYTANALEIVNDTTVPMFQMIRKGPLRIAITGIFYDGSALAVASDKGVFFANPVGLMPPDVVQKPILKYPAWKFPGKYADGSN